MGVKLNSSQQCYFRENTIRESGLWKFSLVVFCNRRLGLEAFTDEGQKQSNDRILFIMSALYQLFNSKKFQKEVTSNRRQMARFMYILNKGTLLNVTQLIVLNKRKLCSKSLTVKLSQYHPESSTQVTRNDAIE